MSTQYTEAVEGRITPAMARVAAIEDIDAGLLRRRIAEGRVIIMSRAGKEPLGIGEGLSTKVNANIGSSAETIDEDLEVEKARIADVAGADTISDLSMGGDIDGLRRKVFSVTNAPITTVPIYQTLIAHGGFDSFGPEELLAMVRTHIDAGISSVVVHMGFQSGTLGHLRGASRIMGMVSKGGSFTAVWMLTNGKENPYLAVKDEIFEACAAKDVVLSLGNTMRSGCIVDGMDEAQREEIQINAGLAREANGKGVQVIIEGMGGHVEPRNIRSYVRTYKEMTGHRPLFVAGPMPMEISVGRDHMAACVGGAMAAGAGADYLCYITPSEHLRLPDLEDVKEGVMSARIAAHIGDSLKYGPSSKDRKLAEARRFRDWEAQFSVALDPERARSMQPDNSRRTCTMCGRFCAIKLMESFLRGEGADGQ